MIEGPLNRVCIVAETEFPDKDEVIVTLISFTSKLTQEVGTTWNTPPRGETHRPGKFAGALAPPG